MQRTMVCLVLAAVVLGVAVAYIPRGEFTVPEHFPVLTPDEIGPATTTPAYGNWRQVSSWPNFPIRTCCIHSDSAGTASTC